MSSVFMERLLLLVDKAWDKAPQLVLTFLVGYLIVKLIKAVIHGLIRVSRTNQAMKGILMSVIDFGLWLLLLAAIMQQVGLTQLSLALSGTVVVVGLAISSGSSAFVQDLVAGIFLAQDTDFRVGYRVKVNDVEGNVEKMDARKIRIRDDKGNLHIFPNSLFDRAAWIVKDTERGRK